MLGNPVRSNPLGVVFPKPYFTTPLRPMYGWLTAHLRAVCPPFSLRTPPPIPTVKPNRIDGKADFICIATTAAELLPIGPLAYTQFGWACSGWNHRSPDQDFGTRHRASARSIGSAHASTLHDEVGASIYWNINHV